MQITLYPHTSHATPHIYPHLETFDVNDGAKRPFPQKLLRVLVDQQTVEARPQYAREKNMRCQIIVHGKCCSFTTMRQLRARIQNCSLLACGASIDARAAAVVLIISAESLLLLLREEQAWL